MHQLIVLEYDSRTAKCDGHKLIRVDLWAWLLRIVLFTSYRKILVTRYSARQEF